MFRNNHNHVINSFISLVSNYNMINSWHNTFLGGYIFTRATHNHKSCVHIAHTMSDERVRALIVCLLFSILNKHLAAVAMC